MTGLPVLQFSPGDRVLAGGFVVGALLAGVFSLYAGQSIHELATAPRYHPTFPSAADVRPDVRQHRLTWLVQRTTLAGTLLAEAVETIPDLVVPGSTPTVETLDRGNWIRVPALSLNLPLATARTLESTDVLAALQVGVVRYPNGVEPGHAGVVAVAGHSTGEPWKGRYRFAFLNARKLHPGDTVSIDHEGMRYTYRVTGQRLARPGETSLLESAADRAKLTLITCWPLWTTKQRLLVDAELVDTARLVVAKD